MNIHRTVISNPATHTSYNVIWSEMIIEDNMSGDKVTLFTDKCPVGFWDGVIQDHPEQYDGRVYAAIEVSDVADLDKGGRYIMTKV